MKLNSCIKFLGAQGGKTENSQPTCIQVTENCLIDAGNVLSALADATIKINKIFITHTHLDHILDLGFILDFEFARRKQTLQIYALPAVIETLKQNYFNDLVWPDFTKINLINSDLPALEFIPIEFNQTYQVAEGVNLIPVPANHTVETCGFHIEKHNQHLLFSADTYQNPALWQYLKQNPQIENLVIDVSFPNRLRKLAEISKHLTPELLFEELQSNPTENLYLYIYHLKPGLVNEIKQDLIDLNLPNCEIITDGSMVNLAQPGLVTELQPVCNQQQIAKLNKIGIALSAEKHLNKLLEMIVTEAKNLTQADGGTLYLIKNNQLHFTVAQTDSLGVKMGGVSEPISWPPLEMYLEDGSENTAAVAVNCALRDEVICIDDIYNSTEFSFEGAKSFDTANNYRSQSMLVVPLKNFEQKVIGVLQLLNKQDVTQNTVSFGPNDQSLSSSLASQAAVAITNAKLVDDLEKLLEAFLNSIIYTIGRKSPYTAGHINRMVVLSEMLSQQINQDQTVFADHQYSPEQLQQIKLAALMHDIGKLATPEVVMDKRTKLDGQFDRIELVQTRADLIAAKLDNLILQAKIAGQEPEPGLVMQQQRLQQAIELVQQTNPGAEFLPDEKVASLADLVQTPFELGAEKIYLLTADEAYNLSVQRGTLTAEEREIINEHAEIGMEVLKQLPFPEKYQDIPHIAGAHHEKINGTGYPLGLQGDEISFEARILAVADVFEALTSHDRPYKKPNSLNTAMKILFFMAQDNELDKDLVKFFYDSGLYLRYAKAYLPAELIDEVTVDFSKLG